MDKNIDPKLLQREQPLQQDHILGDGHRLICNFQYMKICLLRPGINM